LAFFAGRPAVGFLEKKLVILPNIEGGLLFESLYGLFRGMEAGILGCVGDCGVMILSCRTQKQCHVKKVKVPQFCWGFFY